MHHRVINKKTPLKKRRKKTRIKENLGKVTSEAVEKNIEELTRRKINNLADLIESNAINNSITTVTNPKNFSYKRQFCLILLCGSNFEISKPNRQKLFLRRKTLLNYDKNGLDETVTKLVRCTEKYT